MPITRYLEFSGAMNTKVNQFLMRENELSLAKNTDFSTIGSIEKSKGATKYKNTITETAKNILGLEEYRKNGDNTRTAICVLDTTIYHTNTAAETWTAYTGAGTGLTANKQMEFETFMDVFFAVNGSDANRVLVNGSWSTSSYVLGSPIASKIKKYKDSLYLAGNPLKKNRVWKSDVALGNQLTWGWATGTNGANTGEVFTSAGATFKTYNIKIGDTLRIVSGTTATVGDYIIKSVDSETQLTLASAPATNGTDITYEAGSSWFEPGVDDGDDVTGFGENSDRLLVFKNHSIYRWDGSVPIRIADIGTPYQRSVINIDSWTLFANRKGVYAYDGADVRLISMKVQKFIDAIDFDTLTNGFVAWSKGNQYKLFIGSVEVNGESHNNVVLVYDIMQNNWWFETLVWKPTVAANFVIGGQMRVLAGNETSEVVLTDSSNTDMGKAIDMVIKFGEKDFDFPELYKKIPSITVICKEAEGSNLYLIADGGNPQPIGQLQMSHTSFKCDVRGLKIEPMIIHSDGNSRPVIEGIIFEWEKDGEI